MEIDTYNTLCPKLDIIQTEGNVCHSHRLYIAPLVTTSMFRALQLLLDKFKLLHISCHRWNNILVASLSFSFGLLHRCRVLFECI